MSKIENKNDLIPVARVLDDMFNPDGGPVSWAARDYYYTNYATDTERKQMDKEDRIQTLVGKVFLILFVLQLWQPRFGDQSQHKKMTASHKKKEKKISFPSLLP